MQSVSLNLISTYLICDQYFSNGNNNDAQEVKHAPKDFSGDYLQRPCSKSFASRG